MEPRIFVRVSDGLGNQMFQYAVGRAQSLRVRLPLSLDVSWFDPSRKHNTSRRYGLSAFPIHAETATPQQLMAIGHNEMERRFGLVPLSEMIAFFQEPSRRYWPQIGAIAGAAYLRGFWQSPRYFEPFADVVRADLAPPRPTSVLGQKLAAEIAVATNAVAVHVRRTDYVDRPRGLERFAGCCPPEYYSAAIDRLAAAFGPLSLFLFSDDPAWVRGNFDARGHAATVVDIPAHVDAPYFDLHLMALARHHVIANSTFSWWGAWLKSATGGAVMAPRRWYADEGEATAFGTIDRYPTDWTVV